MEDCPFDNYPGMRRFLLGNMARKKDTFLVSEGPEGSGKSTTTGNICRDLEPNFSITKNTIFTLDELLGVMDECLEGQVYDLDEAINIFHNQDWATWELKALTKIIRQMRIMRCTWVANVPDFEGLHPYLRDYRVRMRLYHEPVWDLDGMGNGPAKVLWRQERFDYDEQRVVHRWQDVFDLPVESLDLDPEWKPYEAKKRANFKRLVADMTQRKGREEATERRRGERELKAVIVKLDGVGKKARQQPPPTTT